MNCSKSLLRTRNLNLAIALVGMIGAGATASYANSIELVAGSGYAGYTGGSYDPFQYSDGGEFTVLNNSGSGASSFIPGSYSTNALYTLGTQDNPTGALSGLTGFETFCVQGGNNDVYFTPGAIYSYTLSENVLGGNRTIPLSAGVAWLYSEFATGTLAGYDYTGPNRNTDAGELQAAIWYLLGETGSGSVFSDAAVTHFGGGAGGLAIATESVSTYGSTFGVSVMNLTYGDYSAAQNQLYYSVPDNGTTVGLMGISLLTMAIVGGRRRLRRRMRRA
jgi:hypothetical protein